MHLFAPRSFRGTIVAATVGLTTVAMVVVVLGIQLVLEYTAQRDIEQVLSDRSQAMVTIVQQASSKRLTVPGDLLEPGMVMTIEPGVYVSAFDKSVDKRWRGIGIRIEDDVQVTREGVDVLTRGLPTTVAEIERHMGAA